MFAPLRVNVPVPPLAVTLSDDGEKDIVGAVTVTIPVLVMVMPLPFQFEMEPVIVDEPIVWPYTEAVLLV